MASFLKQKKRGRPVRDLREPIPPTIRTLRAVANTRRELGLTPKQEEFAKLYASGTMTQTEAARRAGYKGTDKTLRDIGWMLLSVKHYPRVVNRVREIKEELSLRYDVTFENHVKKMAEIRDAALEKGNFTAAVAAEKSRGQVAGLYISRQEIMVGKIDQMSREEVMAEIKRIQSEFPLLLGSDNPSPVIEGVFVESFEDATIPVVDDRDENLAILEAIDREDGDMDED
jgi:hypothetical protein